eukprot:TRINITY_DN9499_c0_g1_i5.p1 TRINITY_DN9499_c0_g1~~TRINITY_DN9499_c0_g1_i5.p1  ORF type:complete len:361 (-),score=-19.22 TRINITY_DN9499_c0_g1_i5:798-1763(-)
MSNLFVEKQLGFQGALCLQTELEKYLKKWQKLVFANFLWNILNYKQQQKNYYENIGRKNDGKEFSVYVNFMCRLKNCSFQVSLFLITHLQKYFFRQLVQLLVQKFILKKIIAINLIFKYVQINGQYFIIVYLFRNFSQFFNYLQYGIFFSMQPNVLKKNLKLFLIHVENKVYYFQKANLRQKNVLLTKLKFQDNRLVHVKNKNKHTIFLKTKNIRQQLYQKYKQKTQVIRIFIIDEWALYLQQYTDSLLHAITNNQFSQWRYTIISTICTTQKKQINQYILSSIYLTQNFCCIQALLSCCFFSGSQKLDSHNDFFFMKLLG